MNLGQTNPIQRKIQKGNCLLICLATVERFLSKTGEKDFLFPILKCPLEVRTMTES